MRPLVRRTRTHASVVSGYVSFLCVPLCPLWSIAYPRRSLKFKYLILSTFLIGLLILSAQTGYACWCNVPEAPEAFQAAGAVFVGQVVEIIEPSTTDPEAPPPGRFYVIKFKVERSWRGAYFTREIEVLSAQGQYGCFAHPPVSKGERYLIYADSWHGLLSISACSRTALITDPIKPGAVRTKVADPAPVKAHLSMSSPANGIDAAADLRILESLLFPTFQFNYRLGREPGRPLFLNFVEPEAKRF